MVSIFENAQKKISFKIYISSIPLNKARINFLYQTKAELSTYNVNLQLKELD